MTKYYLVEETLPKSEQLTKGAVIKDVGTNMFFASSVGYAIANSFQQLNSYERDLVGLCMNHELSFIKDVTK